MMRGTTGEATYMSEVAVAGIRARALRRLRRHRHRVAALSLRRRCSTARRLMTRSSRIGSIWRELQPGTILFQTPTLLATWARHFARGAALATVVLRHGSRPVLIWPLLVERRGLVRVACGAGAPISQYDEILLDPDADAKAALGAALDALRQSVRPDLVLLERVRADSTLRAALSDTPPIGCARRCSLRRPVATGWRQRLPSAKPYAAKQQRKRMKRFAKAGDCTVALAGDPAEAEAWLLEALTLKRNWLREHRPLSRAFVQGRNRKLPRRARANALAAPPRRRAWSSPSSASTDAPPRSRPASSIAAPINLYLRAFAPEFANLGPGNVLTERMLEWCAENGIERYDMLAPRSRNKAEWQSGEVGVVDFALPMTWRGRLYAATVPTLLAPMLRDAFYALPAGLRSAIAGMTLRM